MIPCFQLHLEIEVPDESKGYFIIEQDLIEGDRLLAPPPNAGGGDGEIGIGGRAGCISGQDTFVLDESCLDSTIDLLEGIGAEKPNFEWVDVLSASTELTIDRGIDTAQSVVGTPLAGILSANILDPDLRALETQKLAIGQRCRVRAGDDIVFSGVVNALRSDYNAVDVPTLYLEAVDSLGLLNTQMVDKRPQENYKVRMKTAVEQIGLDNEIQDTDTILTPTDEAMSALDLLIETQDSEGSVCWIDRFGMFYSTNRFWKEGNQNFRNSRFGDAPAFQFTNNPKGEIGIQGQEICCSAYAQTSDTRQVINGITFYNYTEEDDTDRDGNPIKVIERKTHTYESDNSRRLYGDAGLTLTTYLPENTLPGYADYIFSQWDAPRTKVERIEFPADKFKDTNIPDSVFIDIGDAVNVRIDDPLNDAHTLAQAQQRVARIQHKITPTEWLVALDLL